MLTDWIVNIIIILLIVMVFLYYWTNKKNERKIVDERKNMLYVLKEYERELEQSSDEKLYKPKEMNKVEEEVQDLLAQAIYGNIDQSKLKVKMDSIKSEISSLKSETKKEMNKKSEIVFRVQKVVDDFKIYIDTNSFYPKNLLFDANKLVGSITDINFIEIELLPKELAKIENDLKHFDQQFRHFKNMVMKINRWLENHQELSGNAKQELYFYLHNGEFDKAEALFKQLNEGGKSVSQNYEKI